MRRLGILLILIFLVINAGAQGKRVVTGTVTETGGNAVGGAVVKALGDKGKLLGFATSTPKGDFRLRIPADAKGVRVAFAAMGFAADTLALADGAEQLDVIMLPAAFELPEVKAQLPAIRSRGDTLKYSVDAFKSDADRTIEDVIRKLPGVDVSGDGTIRYQGKSISNFYIEGLDMLKGRYSLATRNVKPDDIATVDIYENHQAQRVLQGIVPSDDAAMNLTLKNKSMLRPVGNAKAGVGVGTDGSGLWLGELFTMLIGPGSQMMVTAKGNNSGSNYNSELKNHLDESSGLSTHASGLFPSLPFGSAPLPGNRYFRNRSFGASANAAWKLSETKTVTAWADFSSDRNSFSNSETIDYAGVEEELSHFQQEVSNNLKSENINGQLSFQDNSKSVFIDEKLFFNAAFMNNRYDLYSNRERVGQRVRADEYKLYNSLEATLRSGKKVWRLKSDISVGNLPVGLLTGYDEATSALFLSQSAKATRFFTDETANCSWALGGRWVLGVEAGFMADWSDLRSLRADASVAENNDDSGYKMQASVSPTLQWTPAARTTVTFRVPVKALFLRYVDRLTADRYPTQRVDFDASFRLSHRFSGLLNAALGLYEETNLGGIRDYVTGPIFRTYREASALGMGALSRSRRWGANTAWRWRNPIQGLFFSLLGDASTSTQNSMATSEIEADEVISGREEMQNRMNTALATFSGSKYFAAAKTTLNGSITTTWMSSEALRQDLKMKVDNLNWRFSAGVQSTLFQDVMTLDASAAYSLTTQTIGIIDSKNHLRSVDAQGKVSVRPVSRWELWCRPSYKGQDMASAGFKNYFFLDAGSRITLDRVELELQARNLTDRRVFSYSSFSGADLYAWSFALRPLEVLLSLKYSF